ncbi:hypothetical protein DDR33_13555 [Pararcticibacter amylolyticus]|uniref:Uncharacterized protein n=1 Tax=Pararcticibacter amylolyticus TaxID=2173175 RepID=A0A2U2PFW1_9SPHI|nr:hypothetical protein DDR33_13555 [Pararcticibacter amylolyticus]
MARAWYSYLGGNPEVPGSYRYVAFRPNCRTGFNLCAIYAIYGGTRPASISDNLKDYIAAGLSSGVPEPSTPAGTTSYVYMKP